MAKYRYYVYVEGSMYDWFETFKEAKEFIENFNCRYPNIPCQIKRVRWE